MSRAATAGAGRRVSAEGREATEECERGAGVILAELSAPRCLPRAGRKKWHRKMSSVTRKLRNAPDRSLSAPAMLPNEEAVAALPCIQHILDANRLTWPDVRHHPDCQFASFIHASQQQEPTWDLIIDTRRKCRSWLRLNPPDDFFPEAWTKRCNEYSIFNPGLVPPREGRVMNTPYAILQAYINAALISL